MNKKKILSSLLIVAFFTAIIVVGISWNNLNEAKGAPTDVPENSYKVIGWAWSDNIGWIEFNPSFGGVFYNNDTGEFSGYAWSDNIGWIKFDVQAISGKVGGSGAKTVSDLKNSNITNSNVSDWARACAGTTSGDCSDMDSRIDGWDGWVKMSGEVIPAPGGYSVTIGKMGETETNKRDFHGYAWGSDVVGWISFNCMEGGPNGSNICLENPLPQKSNYKVQIDFSSNISSSSSNPNPNLNLEISCDSPASASVGETVVFTAKIESEGTPPYSYKWSGNAFNSSEKSIDSNEIKKSFQVAGTKEAFVRVEDSRILPNPRRKKIDCKNLQVSSGSHSSSSKPNVKIIEI